MKGKVQIEYDKAKLEKIRRLAVDNGRKTNLQELFNIAVDIAMNSIQFLDEEGFNQVHNLKKIS